MKPDPAISAAQTEVWAWKERAYEEVKHLPIAEQVREIVRQAQPLAAELRARRAARKKREAETARP